MKTKHIVAATFPVLLTLLAACSGAPMDPEATDDEAATTATPGGYQLCRVELGTTVQRTVKYTKGYYAATKGFSLTAVTNFNCGVIVAEHGVVTPVSSFADVKKIPFAALAVRGIFTTAEVAMIKADIASYVVPDDPQSASRWNFHQGLGLAQDRVNGLLEFLDSATYGANGACNNAKGWHLTQFPSPNQYGFTCQERATDSQTLVSCPKTPTTKWDEVPQSHSCTVPLGSAGAPTTQVGTINGVKILQNGCYFDFRNTSNASVYVKAQWTVDNGSWAGSTDNKGPSCNAAIGAGRSSSCSAWGTYGRAVTLTINDGAATYRLPNGC